MKKKTMRYVAAAAATALSLAMTTCPSVAVPRHKSMTVQSGTTTRVANHTYFKASTCQSPTVPKIVVRQKPAKGSLSVKDGVLPLRNARTEKAKACIGNADAHGDYRVHCVTQGHRRRHDGLRCDFPEFMQALHEL
jgi:hypothetical protein